MRLLWRTEYKSDSEKTTTKSTEQLDLCLRWQQTNHQHPYLNMCPRQDSLLTRRSRAQRGCGSATRWLWESASPQLKAVLPLPARRLLKHLHAHSQLSKSRFSSSFGKNYSLGVVSNHQTVGLLLTTLIVHTHRHTHVQTHTYIFFQKPALGAISVFWSLARELWHVDFHD